MLDLSFSMSVEIGVLVISWLCLIYFWQKRDVVQEYMIRNGVYNIWTGGQDLDRDRNFTWIGKSLSRALYFFSFWQLLKHISE